MAPHMPTRSLLPPQRIGAFVAKLRRVSEPIGAIAVPMNGSPYLIEKKRPGLEPWRIATSCTRRENSVGSEFAFMETASPHRSTHLHLRRHLTVADLKQPPPLDGPRVLAADARPHQHPPIKQSEETEGTAPGDSC